MPPPLRRALLACLALVACGARTELRVSASSTSGSGTGGSAGAGAAGGGGVSPGGQPGADPCAAAVSGPKPMTGSCSTRDGRSRVRAPVSPHVTWTTKLPKNGATGDGTVTSGTANEVYVVRTAGDADVGDARRVNAANGTTTWMQPITPDAATGTPVVLSSRVVELYAYDPGTKASVLRFDAETGSVQTTTFGFDLYYAPSSPAVGADGSLYRLHSEHVGTAMAETFISRVLPDDTVAWTSQSLLELLPPGTSPGSVFPSTIALAPGDLAVTVMDVPSPSGLLSVAAAFANADGAVRWSTQLIGQRLGGPLVRPGGDVVIVLGPPDAPRVAYLDGESGAATTRPLDAGVLTLHAVTRSGTLLAGTGGAQGVDALAAIDADGDTLWTKPGAFDGVTVTSDDVVVSFGATIRAFDASTGATRWELPLPVPGSCLLDAALTSAGGIVGLQCDGTLFGASD